MTYEIRHEERDDSFCRVCGSGWIYTYVNDQLFKVACANGHAPIESLTVEDLQAGPYVDLRPFDWGRD